MKISKKIIFLCFVMSLNMQASLTLWDDLNIKEINWKKVKKVNKRVNKLLFESSCSDIEIMIATTTSNTKALDLGLPTIEEELKSCIFASLDGLSDESLIVSLFDKKKNQCLGGVTLKKTQKRKDFFFEIQSETPEEFRRKKINSILRGLSILYLYSLKEKYKPSYLFSIPINPVSAWSFRSYIWEEKSFLSYRERVDVHKVDQQEDIIDFISPYIFGRKEKDFDLIAIYIEPSRDNMLKAQSIIESSINSEVFQSLCSQP